MGYIIVIEGTDGSGKKTQTEKLYERLKTARVGVSKFSFPNYDSPSSGPVKMYLNGDFGDSADSIDAYQASALYAVDRLCSYNTEIKQHYESGEVVILDRYTTANMLHQAGKIHDIDERNRFLDWLTDFEFNTLKLPKPDKVIFLDVPVDVSKKLANARAELKSGQSQDVIEKDKEHLTKAYNNGKYIAEKYGWTTISCVEDGNLRTIDDINNDIYRSVIEDIMDRDKGYEY